MKKKNKWLVSLLLAFVMVLQTFTPLQAAGVIVTQGDIPTDAAAYVYNHYEEVVKVVKKFGNNYKATTNQFRNAKLGTPFVIYEINKSVQDEIYYYPLLDSRGKIILLISVMGTTEGWSLSASEEWVDELEELDNITSDFIFYKSGDNLYAENKRDEFCIAGGKDNKIKSFSNKPYSMKKKAVSNAINRFQKTDVKHIMINEANQRDTYTPSFSSSTSSSKICSLYNKKGQGNYGLCWAAAVATICNYRRGTNIAPKAVANEMNVDYEKGTTPYKAQQALNRFGVSYKNLNMDKSERMSWSSLKTNINNKYPVYVSAKSGDEGHAVTAYGYAIAAGTKYVSLWNSGENSGKGKSISVVFKERGTTFTYNNLTYTWTYSISKY